MTTMLALTAPAATSLAYGPWRDGHWGPGPWFLLFPLVFWTTVVLLFVFFRRRQTARQGEGTLRDVYARGEISEAEYRARLAVLRETRR
jgi:putative membrane protein